MPTVEYLTRADRPTSSAKLVCHCFKVTEAEIREAIDTHRLVSTEQVTECTLAGAGCTACRRRIQRILQGLPPTCGALNPCNDCGAQQSPGRTRKAA